MPRTRQLDIPIPLRDDGASVPATTTEDNPGGLLVLDFGLDEELISHSHLMARHTKFWLSSSGDVGCFATGFSEVLTEVAAVTGTNIILVDEVKGVQISGSSVEDVEDASAKLTRIEKPLSCLVSPKLGNMSISTEDKATQYSIQNYSSLNKVALRRVLTDPATSLNLGINQMFVTTSLSFDEESQTYKLPENIINPLPISSGPRKSRIWNGYTFPEVGKGDGFILLDSVEDTNIPAANSVISPTHPFLTAEKAKQVNKWVAEGKEMGTTSEQPEQPPTPPPESSNNTVLLPVGKRGPAIKTRRPISSAIPSSQSVPPMAPVTRAESIKTPDLVPKEEDAPRKIWKMTYSADAGNTDVQVCCPKPVTPYELRDVADSFVDASTRAAPKPCIPGIFNETKYGFKKHSHLPDNNKNNKNGRNSPKATRKGNYVPFSASRRLDMSNVLVDVTAPDTIITTPLPMMRADHPSLIPLKSNFEPEQLDLKNDARSWVSGIANDLNSLVIEGDCGSQGEPGSALHEEAKSDRNENLSEQIKRHVMLEETFLKERRDSTTISEVPTCVANSPGPRSQMNAILAKRRLEELERGYKAERKLPSDEMVTREFHRTMNQKAPKPSHNASSKISRKAERQATLEDAWGIKKKPTKKKVPDHPASSENMEVEDTSARHTAQDYVHHTNKVQGELSMSEDIKQLYEVLKPTLEAAEYFPGSLTLETQIGLALIPVLPKTYEEGLIPLSEWAEIMQPKTGVSAPTTKFIDRLTTSGLDVDHIVDLKTSDKKRRFFEHEDNEYSVFYEFHCRSKTDQPIIVVVDERGKYSIKNPAEALGAVNIHFPGNIWDARMIVRGNITYPIRGYQEVEDAARYMVDHLWVQPDKHLVRLFTKLPKDQHLTVEKVLMKRWTRYRYIGSNNFSKDINTTDTSSSTGGKAGSVGSKSAVKDTISVSSSEQLEAHDLLLQVTEVQNLLIGSSPVDTQAIRARCAPLAEMVRRGRQWYEVSLVSSAVDAILKSNANIEVGERTDDWRSLDLFGNNAILLHDNMPDCPDPELQPRPVASAVGAAGIGDLLRLTKEIVQSMDGVGFWNYGPCVDAARILAAGSLNTPSIPNKAITPSLGAMIKADGGLNFNELESIKEVGSSIGGSRAANKPNAASSDQKKEQLEMEYW
ncbi:hypothetical protein BDV26DRAFT_254006 [Aspergillus bertholletiae]|uniref:Uncharacterized protein n=1 Tax=Aspergillus bertholletiae TaxID=1226010 RepID=A0A5N7BK71_9EURO|nr:hypothetical protein BDV26DRAFT_254006 [Aspergillus bertholletiae]